MDKDYILHKYLNGDATPEEVEVLKAFEEYAEYLKIADASSGFDLPVTFNSEANFESIQKKKVRRLPQTTSESFKRFLKIAAVFLVLAAGYLFVSSMETSVSTQIAEKKTFTLPDNSIVELNSNSNVTYKKRNWKSERNISLDGEAYFKVMKGSKFNVETKQGIVSVLGTQFNVFSRDAIFSVNCFEGLVSVSFNDTLYKLPAGNRISLEKNGLITQSKITSTQPDWINGESSFENATLATVIEELQRQYPIQISAPDSLLQRKFTGSFTHTNIETALRSVCDPLRIGYSANGDEVTLYAK